MKEGGGGTLRYEILKPLLHLENKVYFSNFRIEEVGLSLLDELRQIPARHGDHGCKYFREGL